jgi:hypothetical protein
MSYLLDDDYDVAQVEKQGPTKQQLNALKQFIKQFVKDKGHKAEMSNVCKACHAQFPCTFTWGELETVCKELSDEWASKRAAKEAAKASGGGTP